MKILSTVLTAVLLTAGAALAQVTTTTTPPGAMTTITPSTATTVTTVTTPASPVVVVPYTTSTMPMAMAACPVGMPVTPTPCAAKTSLSINNHPQVLVLGREEAFALSNLGVRRLNWQDVAINSPSVFSPTNPLLNYSPNASITRHGNPNFPYYAIDRSVKVAGSVEQFIRTSSTLPADADRILSDVKEHYRGLTPQQAIAMGYLPMAACVQNVGFVYLNQSLIDNRFDPMMPEAFSFDENSNLLSVHYILLSDVPFAAFGQQFQSSPIVQGAMQLPVWLYRDNDSGMFMLTNPDINCTGVAPTAASTAPVGIPTVPAERQY